MLISGSPFEVVWYTPKTIFRSTESLRWPIAMGWRPSSCVVRRPSFVVRRPSCVNIFSFFLSFLSRDTEHGGRFLPAVVFFDNLCQNFGSWAATNSTSDAGEIFGLCVNTFFCFCEHTIWIINHVLWIIILVRNLIYLVNTHHQTFTCIKGPKPWAIKRNALSNRYTLRTRTFSVLTMVE